MNRIKFGTDGWRAVIARDFTVENVARVSMACSTWLQRKYREATVVIGYDCRFGGPMFAEAAAKILGSKGIRVILSDRFTSTPVVSFVVNMMKAELGIMLTASHNPPDYNGFKLKGTHGGPLFDEDVRDIENMIDYENQLDLDLIKMETLIDKDILTVGNIEEYYVQHVSENFDLPELRKYAPSVAFDPMYGSGQNILGAILPGIKVLHQKQDFSFGNTPPEPLERNLGEFLEFVRNDPDIKIGIAVDGDADRIALVDENGNYIDSHHIILLLIHYLAGYLGETGSIITGFSSTVKVEKLAEHYGLQVKRVKIGFKEISRHMVKEDVLVGGEESGGISVKGHIAERDGIWMGLIILRFMHESGKSLSELINEIYSITGSFAFARSDLHITRELKNRVLDKCQKGIFDSFGDNRVEHIESLDGYKYFFDKNSWFMIRPSGTEPILRTYAEAPTMDQAKELLASGYRTIMSS
ncbi:MAG TPA: hypothetical protein VE870_04660 [Bacteroidales bacterium]|nr:hypothetical protein [Bacteroidales bacterium]